jgi:hypothetical protein
MERPTLEAMLDAAAGIERSGDRYAVAEGYSLSIYLGEPGQAMEVSEVAELALGPAFCEATSREHNAAYYVEYSSLHGLCVRPPSGGGGRRAGFRD